MELLRGRSLRRDAMYLVVLALGGLWAGWHLRNSYIFYDEWTIVHLIAHHPAHELVFQEHNGHMWVLGSLMYRIQLHGWGLQSHWFINTVLVCALVALHASLTRLLRRSSVSPVAAVLLAGAFTYLGEAGQNIVFAVQFSLMLSLALGVFAIGTVVSGPLTRRRGAVVAITAALAVFAENGGSLVTLPLVTVLLVGLWGRRAVLLSLPAWLVTVAWTTFAPSPNVYPASLRGQVRFAARLVVISAGALVGHTERAGIAVLLVIIVSSAIAIGKGWVGARERWLLGGAVASIVCVVGAITRTRAGLPSIADFEDYNRYLQVVALPMAIAATPMVAACWAHRPSSGWWRARATVVAAPLLAIGLFAAGVSELRWYDARFDAWNHATRGRVHDVAIVLRDGCPSGAAPDLTSTPLGGLGPMVVGSWIAELVDAGFLEVPTDELLDPDPVSGVLGSLCPNG